jgi:hypothetical protein
MIRRLALLPYPDDDTEHRKEMRKISPRDVWEELSAVHDRPSAAELEGEFARSAPVRL